MSVGDSRKKSALAFEAVPLDPKSRLIAVGASLLGILATKTLWLLVVFLFGVGASLVYSGQWRSASKRIACMTAPIVPALFIVWGFLVTTVSRTEGLHIAATMSLRVVAAAALALAAFGGLSTGQLAQQLRAWGLGDASVAAALGSLTIWPEMRIRAAQIIEARYARGLLPRRSLLHSVVALPFILRPLVIWSLRSALLRAEAWERRGLIDRLGNEAIGSVSRSLGIVVAFASVLWAALAIWIRVRP